MGIKSFDLWSIKNNDTTLKPFLRVNYSKDDIFPPHVELECKYEIFPSVSDESKK